METQQGAKGLVYDRKLEYVRVVKEIREYNQAMYFDHSQRNFLLKDFDKDFIFLLNEELHNSNQSLLKR